jgi:hypothetical protein
VEFPWQLYGVIAYQVVTVDLLCLEFFLQHDTIFGCRVSFSPLTSQPATHTLVPTLNLPSGRTLSMVFAMALFKENQGEER